MSAVSCASASQCEAVGYYDTSTAYNAPMAASFAASVAPTSLKAAPAVGQLSPLTAGLFQLSATLTSNSQPVAGRTINFSSGSTLICSAVTDSTGSAGCDAVTQAATIIGHGGYEAAFAGDTSYLPSSADSPLIR